MISKRHLQFQLNLISTLRGLEPKKLSELGEVTRILTSKQVAMYNIISEVEELLASNSRGQRARLLSEAYYLANNSETEEIIMHKLSGVGEGKFRCKVLPGVRSNYTAAIPYKIRIIDQ